MSDIKAIDDLIAEFGGPARFGQWLDIGQGLCRLVPSETPCSLGDKATATTRLPLWEAIQRKQARITPMQALDSIAPATFGRPLCADAVAASALAVAPESVGILLSLMSAQSLPDDYMVIERGGEVFIEPVSAC